MVLPVRPVCPQTKGKTVEEELLGFSDDEFPIQNFKQIESECLNLNITCPGGLTRESRVPVMLWIHGCASASSWVLALSLISCSGGNRGSGSHWLFDGGAFVQNTSRMGKPVILVTIKYTTVHFLYSKHSVLMYFIAFA